MPVMTKDIGLTKLLRPTLAISNRDTCFRGADLGAVAAIAAFIGIDYIFRIIGCDSALRAFRQTGVAHYAVISDLVSQLFLSMVRGNHPQDNFSARIVSHPLTVIIIMRDKKFQRWTDLLQGKFPSAPKFSIIIVRRASQAPGFYARIDGFGKCRVFNDSDLLARK